MLPAQPSVGKTAMAQGFHGSAHGTPEEGLQKDAPSHLSDTTAAISGQWGNTWFSFSLFYLSVVS